MRAAVTMLMLLIAVLMTALAEFLTPRETAKCLRTTTNTLAQNRYLRRGLPFHRVGRKILYAREDVEAYLAAHRNDPQEETA